MPGVCIRLYSKQWMSEEMLEETTPEIQRASLSNTVLMLKGLGIVDVVCESILIRGAQCRCRLASISWTHPGLKCLSVR